jgi:hypothetical protein
MICFECLEAERRITYDSEYITDGICEVCQRMQTKINHQLTKEEQINKGWPDWADIY